MRDVLPEYYDLSDDEKDAIWANGLFVVDNNVLMNQLRYSPAARASMTAIFNLFETRLWIPYQVAFEFQNNWAEAQSELKRFESEIRSVQNNLDDVFNKAKRYGLWQSEEHKKTVNDFFETLQKELSSSIEGLPQPVEERDKLTTLFTGKVGTKPEHKQREIRVAEAGARKSQKIPPGFKDERPGDYLLWAELLDKAKVDKKDVIFVTDDSKEDWWLRRGSDIFLPQLRAEFGEVTGQKIWAFSSAGILAEHGKRTNQPASEEVRQEVERSGAPANTNLQGIGYLDNIYLEDDTRPSSRAQIALRRRYPWRRQLAKTLSASTGIELDILFGDINSFDHAVQRLKNEALPDDAREQSARYARGIFRRLRAHIELSSLSDADKAMAKGLLNAIITTAGEKSLPSWLIDPPAGELE